MADETINYTPLTEEEAKKLGIDFSTGAVFSSAHLRKNDQNLLPAVFMPMALAGQDVLDQLKAADITVIYEYVSAAGPRVINGYPQFFSMRTLNRDDATRVLAYARKYSKLREQFVTPDMRKPDHDPNQEKLFDGEET